MGDGKVCGARHRLEFDHDLEVALGGKSTIGNIRLLCKGHNLMKAEQHLGRAFMAKFKKDGHSAPRLQPGRSRANAASPGALVPAGGPAMDVRAMDVRAME
jgi:hypothetical protein